MRLNRRSLLMAAPVPLLAGAGANPSDAQLLAIDAEDVARDVAAYFGFGEHSSGSDADRQTGDWLGQRLGALGFEVSRQPVEVPFFETKECTLQLASGTVSPLYAQAPVQRTPPGGLTAPLALRRDSSDDAGLAGKIAIVILPWARHSSILAPAVANAFRAATNGGAVAVIAVTTGPSGEAILLNAPDETLYDRPLAVIGPRAAQPVISAAISGERARLVIDGVQGRRQASNVIAVRGSGPGRLIVTTPASGWFGCAAERGGGIAAFLAFAARLTRLFPSLPMTFAAMSGHEYEYVGGKAFLRELAPPPEDVALWMHLGSGLAALDWHEPGGGVLLPLPSVDAQRYLVGPEAMLPKMRDLMAGIPGLERPYPVSGPGVGGEAASFFAAGYRNLIGNFGNSRFHHSTRDTPETTTGALVAQAATGLLGVVVANLRNRGPGD